MRSSLTQQRDKYLKGVESVMRRTAIHIALFTLLLALSLSAFGAKRHAVGHRPPPLSFSGAIAAEEYQVVGAGGGTEQAWNITYHAFAFPALPLGSKLDTYIYDPDGRLYTAKQALLVGPTDPIGPFWQGRMWQGPFPKEWARGFAVFQVVATAYGKKYSLTARVPVKMPSGVKTGPLDHVVVDASGGVLLFGTFLTQPVVVAPSYLNHPVTLQDGMYIPPGAIGSLPKLITVSSGVNGNPDDLESSSVVVYPYNAQP